MKASELVPVMTSIEGELEKAERKHRGSARITKTGGADAEYVTPPDFMAAVRHRFGPIGFDLAASASNAKAERYYTAEQDSLARDWLAEAQIADNEYAFLNPPFSYILPWARKCDGVGRKLGMGTLLLVPASVGSVWHRKHVFAKTRLYYLGGRIVFQKDPYPKDCMLVHFDEDGLTHPQIYVWDWMNEVTMGGVDCLWTYPSSPRFTAVPSADE